jgi:hypothetical protein
MTTLHPKLSTTRERQFVMAYGACSIWRLLEGPQLHGVDRGHPPGGPSDLPGPGTAAIR